MPPYTLYKLCFTNPCLKLLLDVICFIWHPHDLVLLFFISANKILFILPQSHLTITLCLFIVLLFLVKYVTIPKSSTIVNLLYFMTQRYYIFVAILMPLQFKQLSLYCFSISSIPACNMLLYLAAYLFRMSGKILSLISSLL